METKRDSLWKSIDWITIGIYLILLVFGWFSVCGASYAFGETDFFSFETSSGKQLVWIATSFCLGFVLLMLEEKLYELFAYILYGGMLFLLLITPFLANEDINGSYSWIKLGSVSLQPAEFAKFVTALALAKFMSIYNFSMDNVRHFVIAVGIILAPMMLIVLQNETGSALVYFSFFLMLYREGMSGSFLFSGVCAVIYFVVGIRFSQITLSEIVPTPVGTFTVLLLIQLFTAGLMRVYCQKVEPVRNVLLSVIGVTLLSYLFAEFVIPFNIMWVQLMLCAGVVGYLIYLSINERVRSYAFIALFTLGSAAFFYSTELVFNKLKPYQKERIEVLLGMKESLSGAGYNVNQSKIAIGSGGLFGKGFLNGTQTKLKYVPEQHTDFIFCTVGEEEGFVGSSAVLILYMLLILRIIVLAERQGTTFGRVYGYCVAGIFFFHLFINVGMVLGLTPVIGIPLPFFSYGGSSLWGFTLLLFIFLRISAEGKKS